MYLPKNYKAGKKYPAIITVHPGGGVKEQTSGLYAMKLAEKGYVTLAFDATHQGESEGTPRYLENPADRVEDIRSAVDIGTTFRQGWTGDGTLESQIATLNAIAKQRTAEANGAAPQYTKYVPEQNEITADTHRDMAEASEYYRTKRGQHKNAANRVLFTSFDKVLAYNSFAQIDTLLTQPLLLIAGTEAGSLWQSQLAYDKATGSKELYLIDGATHMDLYDIEKYVNQAVEKMNKFFKQNL